MPDRLKKGYLACLFATIGLALFLLILYAMAGFSISRIDFSSVNMPWHWVAILTLALLGLYSSSLLVGACTYDRIASAKSMIRATFLGAIVALTSLTGAVAAGASLNFVINVWKILFPGSLAVYWSHNDTTVWSAFTTWIVGPVVAFVFYGWPFWLSLGLIYGAIVWTRAHRKTLESVSR